MPGPLSDADYDWIWHSVFALGPSISNTETETALGSNRPFVVDSKAMRKLKPNQVVAWVMEGELQNGTPTFDANVACRMLFKLG